MWFYLKSDRFLLSGRRIAPQDSLGIPVTSVGACTSDRHIASYSSTTCIWSRDAAADRHLSAESLDLWEILLNPWKGRDWQHYEAAGELCASVTHIEWQHRYCWEVDRYILTFQPSFEILRRPLQSVLPHKWDCKHSAFLKESWPF